MVHNLIGLVQHVTFSAHAGVGVFVTEGMIVLCVVQHDVGRIGTYVFVVPLVNFPVFPSIVPGHLDITGFPERSARSQIEGQVLYQNIVLLTAGSLGGFAFVYLKINIDLTRFCALEEQRHGAERLSVLAALGGGNDGLHGLLHRLGVAVGALVLNIYGTGTRRYAHVDSLIVAIRNSLLEHIQTRLLSICGSGVCHAGHSRYGHDTCNKHLKEFSHS